jgi:hypothetical protein
MECAWCNTKIKDEEDIVYTNDGHHVHKFCLHAYTEYWHEKNKLIDEIFK